MRIVFMGTPAFALPSLEAIHRSNHQIVAVITGPDKPTGRGRKMTPPPVAFRASELGYPILQPPSLNDGELQSNLRDMAADLFVVIAFRILPASILDIPLKGTINLHPSLLPKYRGAAPIQHALLNGDTKTAVTTISLSSTIDGGDIMLQREHGILADDNFGTLSERLSTDGAQLIVETIDGIEDGSIQPRAQVGEVTSARKITQDDLLIDWTRSAQDILNQVRAFSPSPGAFTRMDDLRLKIFAAIVVDGSATAGTIIKAERNHIRIGTGDGLLDITDMQLQGRRRMRVDQFLLGTELVIGTQLG